jgi:hypothetical protein
VVVVINPDDRRSVAALLLAGAASTWGRVVNRVTGEIGYAIPSQTYHAVYHLTTAESCTCVDTKRGNVCKHQRAVRIFELLQHASQRPPRRLWPVPDRGDELHPSA